MKQNWHMITYRHFSLRDALKLLLGWRLYIRFYTPDGECHASCTLDTVLVDPRDAGCAPWESYFS